MRVGLLLSLGLGAFAAPSEDAVTSLPGWTGELPSKWYSGFVNISEPDMEMMSRKSAHPHTATSLVPTP